MTDDFSPKYATPMESPGFVLWQVTNLWQRQQRAALEELGLTHVQFVLLAGIAWLSKDGQPITQVQLAHHAKTDVMMTSQVVRVLETRGLITRSTHPVDSRAKVLAITDQGYMLVMRAMRVVEEADEQFFGVLGEEQELLVQLLLRILPGD